MSKQKTKGRSARATLCTSVQRSVVRFLSTKEPEWILGQRAVRDAHRLYRIHRGTTAGKHWVDSEATVHLAHFHWCRYQIQSMHDGQHDLGRAVRLFTLLDQINPDLVHEFARPFLRDSARQLDLVTARTEHSNLWKHAKDLFMLARNANDLQTLDRAIGMFRKLIEMWSNDNDRASVLENLGGALRTRYALTADRSDIDEAVKYLRLAADRMPARDHATCLSELAIALRLRAVNGDNDAGIEEALSAHRAAVAAATDDARPGCLLGLGVTLSERARRTWTIADLDEAIQVARGAAQASALDTKVPALTNLGNQLLERADWSGRVADIDDGLAALREAVRHRRDSAVLRCLGNALNARFRRAGDIADLDEAIKVQQEAVSRERGVRERRQHQASLASSLLARYEQRGAVKDLDTAEEQIRAALHGTQPHDCEYATDRGVLGSILVQRGLRSASTTFLDDAVTLLETAVATLDPRDTEQPTMLGILVGALLGRFRQTGDVGNLDRAVDMLRTALRNTVFSRSRRGFQLTTLGQALSARFERAGAFADLDEAINALREAVRAFPPDHPHQSAARSELADALKIRSTYTGSTPDLDEAANHLRRALDALPRNHPARTGVLVGLSNTLLNLSIDGKGEHLGEALDTIRQAVALTPNDDRRKVALRYNLGRAQLAMAITAKSASDLDAAVTTFQRVAPTTFDEHNPVHRAVLGGLGYALFRKAELIGSEADLDEAIALLSAIAATPEAQTDAGILDSLAHARHARFHRSGEQADLNASTDCWQTVAGIPTESASHRINAALRWAKAAMMTNDPGAVVASWSTVVELLPLLAWRGLDRDDQERQLKELPGMTSAASAAVLHAGAPERALELLEHGRGVLWSQVLDLRADLAEARAAAPDIAVRLEQIRLELDNRPAPIPTLPLDDLPLDDEQFTARRDRDGRRMLMASEWDDLITQLRTLPGHADFLRPPRSAALRESLPSGTVVIVNVSAFRCDAFCVNTDGLRVVPLPDLSLADAIEHSNRVLGALRRLSAGSTRFADFIEPQQVLTSTLDWLWRCTARPVLDALGHPRCDQPTERIWWCPTGPLTMLPLHAAGQHEPDASRDSVLDRVISSYTPTIRALLTMPRTAPTPTTNQKLLIISVPNAPEQVPLPGAEMEAATLAHDFGATSTLLPGPQANHSDVSTALQTYPVVHFACHGRQDPAKPSGGALLLHDRPLTVLDIAGMRLAHGKLAFLSACDTALGGTLLPDENIHLAASLRLAGYQHVIGTLWPIADQSAIEVASTVYRRLFCDGRLDTGDTAEALHLSIRRQRDKEPFIPSLWAPYLHVGT